MAPKKGILILGHPSYFLCHPHTLGSSHSSEGARGTQTGCRPCFFAESSVATLKPSRHRIWLVVRSYPPSNLFRRALLLLVTRASLDTKGRCFEKCANSGVPQKKVYSVCRGAFEENFYCSGLGTICRFAKTWGPFLWEASRIWGSMSVPPAHAWKPDVGLLLRHTQTLNPKP